MIPFEVQPNPALWTPHYHGQFDLSLGKEITDSLICPWGKKSPTFPLNSIRFIIGHSVNTDTMS